MTSQESITKPSQDSQSLDELLIEREMCRLSPTYFLTNYIWIQNLTQQRTERWQPWPYLLDLLRNFRDHREIIILKARQLGISWLVCGYALWTIIFHEDTKVLLLSQAEKEAMALVAKCKFMWSHLPDFLRLKIDHDNLSGFELPVNRSKIEALASTKDAGRSTDASLVIRDELDYHPYAEANESAIGPTVDAGGQSIELSTRNKDLGTNTYFVNKYKRARTGENNVYPIFLGWRLRPVRDPNMTLDEWFEEKIKRKYSSYVVEKEYPETESQALSDPISRAFFDLKALDDMLLDTHEGLPNPDLDTRNGMLRLYKLPVVGKKYTIFCDPSNGVEDPSALIVMDQVTGEEIACFHGKVPADVAAQVYDELARYYNKAFNSFENNAIAGGKFAETIKNLGTPNQAPSINIDGKTKIDKNGSITKYGQYTTSPLKRKILLGLEEAIRKHLITIHTRAAVAELRTMVQLEGELEPAVPKGEHDDLIMAWAGAWYISKFTPAPQTRMYSFYPKVRS